MIQEKRITHQSDPYQLSNECLTYFRSFNLIPERPGWNHLQQIIRSPEDLPQQMELGKPGTVFFIRSIKRCSKIVNKPVVIKWAR